jgi:hypothetical protein
MNLAKLLEYLRNRLKPLIWICCAGLVLLALVDIVFVGSKGAHTDVEHFPAFWSIFGFFACAAIILLSKWYGHLGIMTREDYYEDKPSQTQEESHD